ncbi:MATE family efflux transporter [Frisingicoccus sp.]|uniref:MATE family efflux transporter n=1 Tax=Frisingicoccus sp. TaxID=1918627 RepID=UPI00260DA490|nr:MATE family efflux transporter [Frisingicoccus sp.]MDD6232908.1 MATE family efflux transporter [Frisingicoccus sp.]MDY4922103.1 MATE family efflux transporter [Frisingicoccus sp.]
MASGQVDFGDSNVRRNVLAVAAPMLVAQIVNLLYNIIDRIYIGKIPGEGTLALAGLGLCFPVITMVTAFANLFGLGGAPLCSIARGQKDEKEARKVMNNAFFMLIVTGIILTAIGIIFHKPILYLFGASDVIYPYAADYMVVYMLGTVFVMTSLGMNPYINSQGFAKVGMKTVTLGAVSNIILDPIFIFGLHMGVTGAAVATIISQLFSALWVIKFLTGKKAELTLDFKGFTPDFECIGKIAKLGTSTFVMSFTNGLVQIVCNATLQIYGGDLYISAMTVINSIREIAQTPVLSMADGSSPIISYNYGAGQFDLMKKAIRFMTQICFAYTLLIWGLISAFPEIFIRIFNQDAALINVAVPSLHIYFFGFFMMAFQFTGQCVFKALNKAPQAVFFSIFRKAIIVVPLTLLLPKIPMLGVMGVFMAEPISNFIGGLACYITMQCTILRKI